MKTATLFIFALVIVAVSCRPEKTDLKQVKAEKARQKACMRDCTSLKIEPVCAGKQGEKPKSFGNECVMNNYNCEHKDTLSTISKGECPGSDVVFFNNALGQNDGIDDRGGPGRQFFPNQLQNQFNPSQIVSGSNQVPGFGQVTPSPLPGGSSLPGGSQLPGAGSLPGGWGFPGSQFPESQFPGGQFPGSQFPGGQFPGSQFPGGQFPGGQFPGGQIPGGQIPGINQIPGGSQISTVGPDQLNIQNIWQRPTGQRTTQPTPTTTTAGTSAPSTQSPATRQCLANCPVTSEYNPVCGSDNVTYDNPGRLSCAQACGINVTLFRNSRCSITPN